MKGRRLSRNCRALHCYVPLRGDTYAAWTRSINELWPEFCRAQPASVALTSALGYLIGLAALRTRGDYFAIFTLAVGVMIVIVIERWEAVTGGTDGLIGIPPPSSIGSLHFDRRT